MVRLGNRTYRPTNEINPVNVVLDMQTPFLAEYNLSFARFRSANCQFSHSQAQSNRYDISRFVNLLYIALFLDFL